jgi:hypothetical protein
MYALTRALPKLPVPSVTVTSTAEELPKDLPISWPPEPPDICTFRSGEGDDVQNGLGLYVDHARQEITPLYPAVADPDDITSAAVELVATTSPRDAEAVEKDGR